MIIGRRQHDGFAGALRLKHAGHDLDLHDRAEDGDDFEDRVHWDVPGWHEGGDGAEKFFARLIFSWPSFSFA